MPKFGLKCFLGSFVFSLVAVFAAAKVYLFYSADSQKEVDASEYIEARNIELFAAHQEDDAILAKYEELTAQNNAVNEIAVVESENTKIADALSVEPTQEIANLKEDILFSPTDDEENASTEGSIETDFSNVVKADLSVVADTTEIEEKQSDKEAFKIVDAAEATIFEIPLTHSFSSQDNNVNVSNRADKSQVALADEHEDINQLGAETKTSSKKGAELLNDDEDGDSPWEVAEVANKNITKNKNAETNKAPVTGNSVPYKMQKNILIPIPDEIANDKNLTPQFSSSAENIKLEEELRRKHGQAPIETSISQSEKEQNVKEDFSADINKEGALDKKEKDVVPEEESSLTDSIAAWFSGNRRKSEGGDEENAEIKRDGASSSEAKTSSLFRKLLGLGAANKDNVAPTELKLSFQANRAEISGQTLEWIKAFSENVVNYDDVAIEIRLDRSAPYELQQKRLKLLYKILANNGVEYRKVNIIFTDREPNSFIIRNVRYITKEEKAEETAKSKSPWY
ncbi:MAG: hypothetical protein IJ099_04395 [Alphaproteobacteria bacterium]|nr:hypothetical protein [Alphaproteobacteria bacterium]